VKYLSLIAPALQRIATEFPDCVHFEVMGGGDFNMTGVPWRQSQWSLEEELSALARFDIGLMPLPAEEWAKGKSGGKARTYMAAGVVPVCTSIGYNVELIQHRESGFLCDTQNDWYLALKTLIEDPAMRQAIAVKARKHVESSFSVAGQAEKLRQLFDDVLAGHHHSSSSR
jgi:glycosyltransferase involved in cell wall biosynthesis